MSKYLLSDGSLTNDPDKELIDRFITRLKLYSDSIPRSDHNGIPKTYSGIDNLVLMDHLNISIRNLASSISRRISVVSIQTMTNGYTVKIRLNSIEHEITVTN